MYNVVIRNRGIIEYTSYGAPTAFFFISLSLFLGHYLDTPLLGKKNGMEKYKKVK